MRLTAMHGPEKYGHREYRTPDGPLAHHPNHQALRTLERRVGDTWAPAATFAKRHDVRIFLNDTSAEPQR